MAMQMLMSVSGSTAGVSRRAVTLTAASPAAAEQASIWRPTARSATVISQPPSLCSSNLCLHSLMPCLQ